MPTLATMRSGELFAAGQLGQLDYPELLAAEQSGHLLDHASDIIDRTNTLIANREGRSIDPVDSTDIAALGTDLTAEQLLDLRRNGVFSLQLATRVTGEGLALEGYIVGLGGVALSGNQEDFDSEADGTEGPTYFGPGAHWLESDGSAYYAVERLYGVPVGNFGTTAHVRADVTVRNTPVEASDVLILPKLYVGPTYEQRTSDGLVITTKITHGRVLRMRDVARPEPGLPTQRASKHDDLTD